MAGRDKLAVCCRCELFGSIESAVSLPIILSKSTPLLRANCYNFYSEHLTKTKHTFLLYLAMFKYFKPVLERVPTI